MVFTDAFLDLVIDTASGEHPLSASDIVNVLRPAVSRRLRARKVAALEAPAEPKDPVKNLTRPGLLLPR